jgi:hypothetical protein
MVVIRPIIAVGALLALGVLACVGGAEGCGSPYPYVGEWVATRDVSLPPGSDLSAIPTLQEVEFDVKPNGDFVLIDKSIPIEGRVDLSSKTQALEIERVLGRPTNRLGPGMKPSYWITWRRIGSLELKNSDGTTILLHPKSKPSKG